MPLDPHPTPRKRTAGKTKRANYDHINLDEKLKAYPHLREKLFQVLDAADNKGGIREADAAEELIVELMKDLGNLTLQTWADNQTDRIAEEFSGAHPQAQNKGKKTSLDE